MRNQVFAVVFTGLTLFIGAALAKDIESFTIKPEDVTKANVGFARDGSVYLEGEFTKPKASEFTAFTERNLKKKTRLVINEKVISEPLINSRITGGSFILECKTADEAVALAKYLMQKISNQVSEPTSVPAASISAAEPMTERMYPASSSLLQEIGRKANGQTNDLRTAFQTMGLSWPDGASIHYRAPVLIVSDTEEHIHEFEAVLGGLLAAVVSNKLETIVLPEVAIQRLSIADTIALLMTESKKYDLDKEGVLIVVKPSQPAPKDTPLITLSMRNVPLGQIIEYCAQLAGLSADVKGGAVVLQYKSQSTSDK